MVKFFHQQFVYVYVLQRCETIPSSFHKKITFFWSFFLMNLAQHSINIISILFYQLIGGFGRIARTYFQKHCPRTTNTPTFIIPTLIDKEHFLGFIFGKFAGLQIYGILYILSSNPRLSRTWSSIVSSCLCLLHVKFRLFRELFRHQMWHFQYSPQR